MNVKIYKLNAFTQHPNGGNPAGVVLDTPSLSEQQMKQISHILQVSETAYVLPSTKADIKVRFFTPTIEVDLCGHATIATSYILAHMQKTPYTTTHSTLTQETNVGILPIDLYYKNSTVERVMMTQKPPIMKNITIPWDDIATSLNISKNNLDTSLPQQIVSTGLFTLPLCAKSRKVLQTIQPDFNKIALLCKKLRTGSFHVFTFDTIEPNSIYHARNFPPLYGIKEDPVTGTANGAVSSYLIHHKYLKPGLSVVEQGDIIGRPGRVIVDITAKTVKVGGVATLVETKTLEV